MSDADFVRMVGQRAHCWPAAIWNTLELARQAIHERIEGDFAECGVFAGVHPAVMAREGRITHLFDSFEGIPRPGPKDGSDIRACIGAGDGELISTGVSACTVAQVEQYMAEWGIAPERLRYHPGWFQHVLREAQIGPLALLRLDCDLYESTKCCLRWLYPTLSPSGFFITDDYGLGGCRKAMNEYFNGAIPTPTPVPEAPGVVWWRKS